MGKSFTIKPLNITGHTKAVYLNRQHDGGGGDEKTNASNVLSERGHNYTVPHSDVPKLHLPDTNTDMGVASQGQFQGSIIVKRPESANGVSLVRRQY